MRLLARVDSHVLLKTVRSRERFTAVLTCVRFFPGVDLDVFSEVARLVERLTAVRTVERPLSRMHFHVLL